MHIGHEIARKLFLGAHVFLRLALLAIVAVFLSQFIVAAARAAEQDAPARAAASWARAAVRISGVRIWPAQDYTRVTLESRRPISHTLLLVKDPDRLVLDLEEIDFSSLQQEIAGKLSPTDPYIGNLRAGRFKPGVVRLVLDLKSEAKPQIFNLKPIGEYGHRLVLDIYPAAPVDPLMALVQRSEATLSETYPVAQVPHTERPSELRSLEQRPSPSPGREAEQAAPAESSARAVTKPPEPARAASRLITIAIDAGHGGEDPGAKGRRGSYEKNITLMIARRLKQAIESEPGMRAVLTRDGDYFVPLHARVEKARRVRADLFVSIHADAFIRPHARGSSVFALSERSASSAAARWLAKRENDADLIGGVNLDVKDRHLAQTLLDLSQTATIQDSLKLGRAVLGELGVVNALHKEQVEQAGFAVLKAPDIPSILVETAFISNPEEEKKLGDDVYQEKIAHAVLRGIKRYFLRNPPLARTPVVAEGKTLKPAPARPVLAVTESGGSVVQ